MSAKNNRMNEFAGLLVRELSEAYRGAFLRYVDPSGRALTEGTFRLVYAAALMRLAAQLAREAGMDEERFVALAVESRKQDLGYRNQDLIEVTE
jgi:hypothetical protein